MPKLPSRRISKGFSDLKRFGWTPADALSLVGPGPETTCSNTKAKQKLKEYAGDYLNLFETHPRKTHVFPARGMIYNFAFAQGVRDAAAKAGRIPNVRMRTVTPLRHDETNRLKPQTDRLKLHDTGAVIHDHVHYRVTADLISEAAQLPKSEVVLHNIAMARTGASALVPIFGKSKKVGILHFFQKGIDWSGKPRLVLDRQRLSERELTFVKRALYTAGAAAVNELLAGKRPDL